MLSWDVLFRLARKMNDKPLQSKLDLVSAPSLPPNFPSNLFILECRILTKNFDILRETIPEALRNLHSLHLVNGAVTMRNVPNSVESLRLTRCIISCDGLKSPLLNLKLIEKAGERGITWIRDHGCSLKDFPNLENINGHVLTEEDKILLRA